MPGEADIELGEVIESLRLQLADAIKRGEQQALRFEVESIEVQVDVSAKREVGAKGEVKFWVVGVGGEATQSKTQTQRITLRLNPTYLNKQLTISTETNQRLE